MQASSEPVQVAPSEVVLWPLVVVQARCPPLEGFVATAVRAVLAVVVVVVVVVVLVLPCVWQLYHPLIVCSG